MSIPRSFPSFGDVSNDEWIFQPSPGLVGHGETVTIPSINMSATQLPKLVITEQPVEKFRFRYKSEMVGAHGSILGRNFAKNRKKSYPTVELKDYPGTAIIRCSLFSVGPDEKSRVLHPHRLIVRQDNLEKDDPHDIMVSPGTGYTAIFQGMGIIHTAKKNVVAELIKKKKVRKLDMELGKFRKLNRKDEVDIKAEAESEAKTLNLNSVSLCFEALREDLDTGCLIRICPPVYSKSINNMKSALTGELKICRIDKHVSPVIGGEEVFMLVEKVGKKNIKVKFYELDDEENEIWFEFASFSELDVHHQYAIVFRTPPYGNLDITEQIEVYVQLYRPSDGDCSEPIKFKYKPRDEIFMQKTTSYLNVEPMDDREVYVPPLSDTEFRSSGLLSPDQDPVFSGATMYDDLVNDLPPTLVDDKQFKDFLKQISQSELMKEYMLTYLRHDEEIEDQMDIDLDDLCDLDFVTTDGCETPSRRKDRKHRNDENAKNSSPLRNNSILEPQVELIEFSSEVPTNNWEFLNEAESETLLEDAIRDLKQYTKSSSFGPLTPKTISKIFRMRCPDGAGPLHQAIRLRETCHLLFLANLLANAGEARKYINDRDIKKKTPLHYAVACNEPEYVRVLLKKNANPNLVDNKGNTAFHYAINALNKKCLKNLLDKASYPLACKLELDKKNEAGMAPLHLAARQKDLTSVKYLLNAGANVNETENHSGNTALHIAVQEKCLGMVQYIVERPNVEVDLPNLAGNTPLHYASASNGAIAIEICECLLKHQANPLKANFIRERKNGNNVGSKSKKSIKQSQVRSKRKSSKSREEQLDEDEGFSQFKVAILKPILQNQSLTPHKRTEDITDDVLPLERVDVSEDLDIKEEPDSSDDENYYDSDTVGQTSLDLAADNPELLDMLKKVKEEVVEEEEEYIDDDDDDGGSEEESDSSEDEFYDIDSCDIPEVTFSFDDETLERLCPVLDKTGNWMTIGEILGFGSYISELKDTKMPSKQMFENITQKSEAIIDVDQVRNILEVLLDDEAVAIIDDMKARKLAGSKVGEHNVSSR